MKKKTARLGFYSLLVTQFLGAFNDNAFRMVILIYTNNLFSDAIYVTIGSSAFILPFLLFSMYAGFLADKFSKKTIIVYAKFAELTVMMLGFAVFLTGNIWLMFLVLMLMGTQSAFFGPSKYGILPEILNEEDLSWGNGIMNMWTNIAIVLGMALGGYMLTAFNSRLHIISIVFIVIAVTGFISSFFVSKVPPSGSTRSFNLNFVSDIWQTIKDVSRFRGLFLSILGYVYFYFVAGMFYVMIIVYAKNMVGLDRTGQGLLIAIVAVGLGAGSVLAGRLSGGKIEFGLVPIGAFGLSMFSSVLGISYKSFVLTGIFLFLLGSSSGFFLIPLLAYIQGRSHPQMKGRILAATYFLEFFAILFATGLFWALKELLGLNTAEIFLIVGAATVIVSVYICTLLPYALVRFVLWMIMHVVYKVKVVGRENVPVEGPAMLVSNHVSYVDGLLIQFSLDRPVRFVVYKELLKNPVIRSLFRMIKAIPISRNDPPREIIKAINEAKKELDNGGLVCIFAEGQMTRTGNMLAFNRGFEKIVKGKSCPIIPVNLDRVWGSIFSYERNKYFFKIPKRMPYAVTVSYGEQMPAASNAFIVRQRVLELGADAFKYRTEDHIPLALAFWKEAKRHPFRFCMADSAGKKLSFIKALFSSIVLSKVIKKRVRNREMVGILLPSTVAAALSNISVLLAEMVPVNLNFTTSEDILAKITDKHNIDYVISSREFLVKVNFKGIKNVLFIEDLVKEVSIASSMLAVLKIIFIPMKIYAFFKLKRIESDPMKNTATVIFSSGSTGMPKGIVLTHANITSNIEGFYQMFDIKKDDKVLGVLPFFHSLGFTATLWFPLLSGMGAVYHYSPLEAEAIGKLAEVYKPTMLLSTPTFLLSYIRKIKPEQFKSLRYVVVGAEKLKEKIAESFRNKYGIIPMEGYGATELSPIVSVSMPDFVKKADDAVIRQVRYKPNKVGHPIPGVVVKVVVPDTFEELGMNQDGLLLAKGGNVMAGYLSQPELTKEAMLGEWYITGDIGNIDEDGFIQLTGRRSRFSKIGGEMVPHVGVEEEIHNAIGTDEQVCAVTSVSDEKKGERLVVLCTIDLNPHDIVKKMLEMDVPSLWIPRADDFHKIDSIPLLGSGKLDLAGIKILAEKLCSGRNV